MAYPKITYTDSNGPETLQFQLPPTGKPYVWLEAARTDTLSTSGVKQSMTKNVAEYLEITMQYAAIGDDMDGWTRFLRYSLLGGPFIYYADGDIDQISANYTLEDTSFKPAFVCMGFQKFALKFRKLVTG